MAKRHVLMVPYPMQGHVIPLMELAQILAKHSLRITFATTENIHEGIIKNFTHKDDVGAALENDIRLVSIPDGLNSDEINDPAKAAETLNKTFPLKIEELILETNGSEKEKITCIVYDQLFCRIYDIAKKLQIRASAFCAAPGALLVLGLNIPKMIEDGIIDTEGIPKKDQIVQFAPSMPLMHTSQFVWTSVKNISPTLQKVLFEIMVENNRTVKLVEQMICNSVRDLEPDAFDLVPNLVSVGPLLASNRLGDSAGHLCKPDDSCLTWLDQQMHNSVIYVAFGSTTIFSEEKFQELATGLELTERPFLWVVRSESGTGTSQNFPEGFLERTKNRGRIVHWAPQQKALSHPSVSCFISHCGWNSTMESISNGVPLLCWPYFADQFMNRSYICDIWRVGLQFKQDNTGQIRAEEIKKMVDQLLTEDGFKERVMHLKIMMNNGTRKGGNSYKNITDFISWIEA